MSDEYSCDETIIVANGETVQCGEMAYYNVVKCKTCQYIDGLKREGHKVADGLAKEIQKFKRERDEAIEALENEQAKGVHSCGPFCKRPMCVMRRERDEAWADVTTMMRVANDRKDENEKLRKAIEDAPHAYVCSKSWNGGEDMCNCWKREALSDE